jgi:plasmid maintenance system antidote protein VapI
LPLKSYIFFISMNIEDFKVGIGKRLLKFAESQYLSSTKLAETIGYKYSTLQKVLNGQNGISVELMLELSNQFPNLDWNWLILGNQKQIENNGNVVVGENNGTMQINNPPSADVLAERVKALEEQLKLKDQIIELLKK